LFKTIQFPIDGKGFKGLAYFFRFTVNHTSEYLARWEGECRWKLYLRKLGGFQCHLTVVRSTTTGTVFRFLVLVQYCTRMTLREENS
jgi:hypothetical protein